MVHICIKNWVPFTQGCSVLKLVKIGIVVLEKIVEFRHYILAFCYNLPLERGMSLYLDNLVLYSPKHALCQVWLKLDQWFWKRTFLKLRQCSFDISFMIISPWEKSVALHLKKLPYPSILCQVWMKFADWTIATTTETVKFRSKKLTWAFSLGELKIALIFAFLTHVLYSWILIR